METKKIDIDTETNSLIESRRVNFSESQNDIIKRCLRYLGNGASEMQPLPIAPRNPIASRKPRIARSSGTYEYILFGKRHHENSLRSAYIACLRHLQARDSEFFDRLSLEETSARRLVAREPAHLYKRTPELAESYAEKIDGQWYVDVNLSEPQVIQRLKIACRVAGISFGSDLDPDFR